MPSRPIVAALLSLLPLCLASVSRAAGEEPAGVHFAEPRADQALVYVLRPKGPMGGNKIAAPVFADDRWLLSVEGNTYAFAFVDPGRAMIWGLGPPHEIELVAGETYYWLCALDGMSFLQTGEARELIEARFDHQRQQPARRAKAERKVAKRMPKMRAWLDEQPRADLPAIPEPAPPADRSATTHVPAGTSMALELMETVSSSLHALGDEVWLRPTTDSLAAHPWLAPGAPVRGIVVEVHPPRGGGRSGGFELAIPALTAGDGTVIPLVGQWIASGRYRGRAASTALAFGGLLGAAAVKGRNAVEHRGMALRVRTRVDAWVSVVAEGSVVETAPPVIDVAAEPLVARVLTPLHFAPQKRKPPSDVSVLVETDRALRGLRLAGVDGWAPPDPPAARRVARHERGWIATFAGRDFYRHGVPNEPMQLAFDVGFEDGATHPAAAEARWAPELDAKERNP